MIDRRSTITLNWRRKGQPARRIDDYMEEESSPKAVELPRQKARYDRRSIESRIENWARWATERETEPAQSQAGALYSKKCSELTEKEREELGIEMRPAGEQRSINEADALLLEQAWRKLIPLHRELLRWHYIRHASRGFICRYLKIKHSPPSVLDIELSKAGMAMEAMACRISDNS